jgi:hypothetical protein
VTVRDDARDAGLLLRYALGRSSPARSDAYTRLLDRYHSDPELRTAFDETASGLGLRVLAIDRTTGLVLTAEPDSPLAVTDTRQWLRIRGVSDRMVYGVALGGVAAWCYPNARSLREPGTRRVTAVDADKLAREHAGVLMSGDSASTLGAAWSEYARRNQATETDGGRLRRDCTVRMCEDVLAMLAAFGLVVADKTVPPLRPDLGVWRSTDRFRAHVAAGGGPLVWQTISSSPVPGTTGTQADDEELS